MTDIIMTIPEDIVEHIDYDGDDLYLMFIIDMINENETVTLSGSQWLYLIDYLIDMFGEDSFIVEWFDNTIESILEC
jgi:hypothetical protein